MYIKLHPLFMFELSLSMNLFVSFNQSLEIIFQSTMSKQVIYFAHHIIINMDITFKDINICSKANIYNNYIKHNQRI